MRIGCVSKLLSLFIFTQTLVWLVGCHANNTESNLKIINGTKAKHPELMVGILFPINDHDNVKKSLHADTNETFRCGAALIDKRVVITAAHCLIKANYKIHYNLNRIAVFFSTVYLDSIDPDNLVRIKNVKIHENFDNLYVENDIAILYLAEDAPKDAKIFNIDEGLSHVNFSENVDVMGWGQTTNAQNANYSNELLQTSLNLYSQARCNKFHNLAFGIDMPPSKFCGGIIDEGKIKDVCKGDSGGPIYGIFEGKPKLFGLVSHGMQSSCAVPDTASFFTNIA